MPSTVTTTNGVQVLSPAPTGTGGALVLGDIAGLAQRTTTLEGMNVVSAQVNASGHLVLTLANATSLDAGGVVGPQGLQGTPGIAGQPGHSPTVAMASDQITVDGVTSGPHLTGPQGPQGSPGVVSATGTAPLVLAYNAQAITGSVSAATTTTPGTMSAADKVKINSYPATYAAPTLDSVTGLGSTTYHGIGVGPVNVYKNNTDYGNATSSAGLVINNDSSGGQNIISSVIGGQVVAKWRTDYVGNITWAAGPTGGHDFRVGGDYPSGQTALGIDNAGDVTVHNKLLLRDAATAIDVVGTGTVSFTYYGQPAGIQPQGIYFPSGGSLQDDGNGGVLLNGQQLGSGGNNGGGGNGGSLKVQAVDFYFESQYDYYSLYWLVYSDNGQPFDFVDTGGGSDYQFSQNGQQAISPNYVSDTGYSGYFSSNDGYVFGRVLQASYEYYTAGGSGDTWYFQSGGDNETNMPSIANEGSTTFNDLAASYFGQ